MRQSKLHVPLTSEISSAMKVAETSVEAAQYVVERLTKILTETKMLDKSGDLLTKVRDFAKYVDFKLRANSQTWSGESSKTTDFKNIQDHMAADAVKTIKGQAQGNVKLDIAIDATGKILRAFSTNGVQIKDAVVVESLDKLFNAWLADHNIVSKASTLYESNEKGEIKQDANGEVTANAERIKKLMNDPANGITHYAKEKGLELKVDMNHTYPAEKGTESEKPTTPSGASGESMEVDIDGPKM